MSSQKFGGWLFSGIGAPKHLGLTAVPKALPGLSQHTMAHAAQNTMARAAQHPSMGAGAVLLIAAVGSHGSGTLHEPWHKTQARQQEYLTQLRGWVSSRQRRG